MLPDDIGRILSFSKLFWSILSMSKGISYSVTPPYRHLVITAKFFKFGPLVTILTGFNCNDFFKQRIYPRQQLVT